MNTLCLIADLVDSREVGNRDETQKTLKTALEKIITGGLHKLAKSYG